MMGYPRTGFLMNICGIQLAIMDVSGGKPLLYQFTWKVIRFIENKKTKIWMRDNSDCIAHLPMVFMAKNPPVFPTFCIVFAKLDQHQ